MKRYDVIKEILSGIKNELIICNIGIPSRELYHIKDRNENFYMLGSMGLASSIALGLAISQPNKMIYCIEGDGSVLMNLGSLSTIANVNPDNLTLIVIDNECYGSTGNQRTYTCGKTKLDIIANGAGFESVSVIYDIKDIRVSLKTRKSGCNFILIKTHPGNAKVGIIPLTPEEIKTRFLQAINK